MRVVPKQAQPAKLEKYTRPGGHGPQVAELQRLLIAAGYGPIRHAVTQFYGPETEAAVVRFHNRNTKYREGAGDSAIGPKGFAELKRQAAAKD
jgi:peptidoglycan hydrolase-like protein with peptidoglycan-binding domain